MKNRKQKAVTDSQHPSLSAATESATEKPATAVATALPVSLDRVVLRTLKYVELATREKPIPIPQGGKAKVGIHLNGKMTIFPEGIELFVEARVTPDPMHKPVEVTAGISGFFKRLEGTSDDELQAFAGGPGLRILFPYLREVVSNVSSRGLYPAIWLNPLSVTILTGTTKAPQGEKVSKVSTD